jgi:predicted dinucleotide-binding enzyme
MRIGIIGSGNIGGTAARLFTEAGHEVALSHSGPPESLRGQVAQLGPRARTATVEEAARFGEVVLLAIPWRNRGALPAAALAGRIVIDAMNPYTPDGAVYDLGDSTSSEEVAKVLPGARLVKAFNALFASDLASRGRKDAPLPARTVIFVAGDDEEAKAVVADLVKELGFAAIDTGSLRDGGRVQEPWSPVFARPLRPAEIAAAVGVDDGELEILLPPDRTDPARGQ